METYLALLVDVPRVPGWLLLERCTAIIGIPSQWFSSTMMPQVVPRIVHRLKWNPSVRIRQPRARDPRDIFLKCPCTVRRAYETVAFAMADKVSWVVDGTEADSLASYTRNDIKGAIEFIQLAGVVLVFVEFPVLMPKEVAGIILWFESELLPYKVTFFECHGRALWINEENLIILVIMQVDYVLRYFKVTIICRYSFLRFGLNTILRVLKFAIYTKEETVQG